MSERRNVVALRRSAPDGNREARHVRAFLDLEPDICDLVRAADLALLAEDEEELFAFTVEQFQKMAHDLKRKFYKAT
jgi:hypothetical protein